MTDERPRVLIVEARYYTDVADQLVNSVITELEAAECTYERLEVPGVFEVPAAILHAMQSDREYAGAIALGCVIRGETTHYDHICEEASRALMDISLSGVPLGFGILTVENKEQALVRADPAGKNKGAEIAEACLRMIEIENMYAEQP